MSDSTETLRRAAVGIRADCPIRLSTHALAVARAYLGESA